MLVPMGEDVAIPVTVVVVGDGADVRSGVLRRMEPETVRLWLPEPLPVGARVVLAVGERTTLSGRVLLHERDLYVVSRDAARTPDDRAAPRVRGPAAVRWCLGEDTTARWINGGPDTAAFFSQRGEVEVSVSGMSFPAGGHAPHRHAPAAGGDPRAPAHVAGSGRRAARGRRRRRRRRVPAPVRARVRRAVGLHAPTGRRLTALTGR
jgi:hypothetical protein